MSTTISLALLKKPWFEKSRPSVYLRHMEEEPSSSSPGGFIGGINAENVLHAEPKARNRLLAEIFQKLGLVERAGIGRRRIFIPPLSYGKRVPIYDADDHTVKLTIFDGMFDRDFASFVTTRERAGKSFDIIELLLLSYLRKYGEIDIITAAKITQLAEKRIKERLDLFCHQSEPWIERRSKKNGVTYHLAASVAAQLLGKEIYSRSSVRPQSYAKAIDKVQWPALIRQYIDQHGSINNSECRELLLLGGSNSAQTTVSRMLSNLDFLEPYGSSPKNRRYRLRQNND